jgi:phosphatidate cytidylyltransferase
MTAELRVVFTALFLTLLAASTIGYILHRRRPGPQVDNLNARIRAWWIMIVTGGLVLLAGRNAIIALFAVLSFLALREFITHSPVRRSDHSALFVCFFVALPVQYLLVAWEWYGLFAIWIPVYCIVTLPVLSMLFSDVDRFVDRTASIQFGLMVCVYCISHIPALLMLRIPGYEGRDALLALFLVLVTQASDVLQYVWGRMLGRHRIAPALSPSKTVEGFVGGILSATALGAALSFLTPFTPARAAAMSLLVTVMGFLGGLVLSAIKRDRGIKDWGQFIEGHGGVLDRLDSLCFSAPLFFHLTRYFYAGP